MERLSARLASATREVHQRAEHSAFVTELLSGNLSIEAYAGMLAQHYYVYAALEDVAKRLRGHPVAGRFVYEELTRLPALARDLRWLLGPDWQRRHTPTAGTRSYAARIRGASARWPAAFIAHHYTRYLGDLSGGRIIKTLVRRIYGLGEDGVRFYTFPGIAKPKVFRDRYRGQLDELTLGEQERERFTEEAVRAFQCNITVFDELARWHLRTQEPVV